MKSRFLEYINVYTAPCLAVPLNHQLRQCPCLSHEAHESDVCQDAALYRPGLAVVSCGGRTILSLDWETDCRGGGWWNAAGATIGCPGVQVKWGGRTSLVADRVD